MNVKNHMKDPAIVRAANPAEIKEWDRLLERFPNYRVSHTAAWLRSLENSIKGELLFLIFEKNGEIAACLPGMIVNIGFLRLFGSPLPGWQTVSMGPVFDENLICGAEIVSLLIPFL